MPAIIRGMDIDEDPHSVSVHRHSPCPRCRRAADPTRPAQLDITTGTKARYRVREQLAGISFPSDAVGTTESVTGTIIVNPDGTIDSAGSKITVDLRTITSDQQMRDGYVRRLTLET